MNNKRKSSIELLRIISMFMIVAYHWQLHAANDSIYCSSLNANQIFSFGIGSWGALGVDIFFIISAYFLLNSNSIKTHKLLNMIVKVSIYGTVLVLVAICCDVIPFEAKTLVKSVMGVFAYQYWFITVYIIIYILHPALNKIIKQAECKYLILLTGTLVCTTYFTGYVFGQGEFIGRLACGITIYVLVGTFERFPRWNLFEKFRRSGMICSLLGIFMLEVLLSYLGNRTNETFYFSCIKKIQITDSVLMLIAGLFMFYFFKNLNLKYNAMINFCGRYIVGAYMLHGGAYFIKDFLWDGLFSAGLYYNKSFGVYSLYYLICIFGLLFVGILSEFLYTKIIERNIEKVYRKINLSEEISINNNDIHL